MFFFLMLRRPPRSTQSRSSAASDVYKRQTIYRLREGIERFMVTDINNPSSSTLAQSELVVMWDISVWPTDPVAGTPSFNHLPGGGNILYMDGHVEFVRYPGEFPICASWVAMMNFLVIANHPY